MHMHARAHTHTHTHTHIYIYIYEVIFIFKTNNNLKQTKNSTIYPADDNHLHEGDEWKRIGCKVPVYQGQNIRASL